MAKEKTTQNQSITFKGQEYLISELSDSSKRYIDHLLDLGKKIHQGELDLEQHKFLDEQINLLLEKSLEAGPEESEPEVSLED
jgi:hypothetical protein